MTAPITFPIVFFSFIFSPFIIVYVCTLNYRRVRAARGSAARCAHTHTQTIGKQENWEARQNDDLPICRESRRPSAGCEGITRHGSTFPGRRST